MQYQLIFLNRSNRTLACALEFLLKSSPIVLPVFMGHSFSFIEVHDTLACFQIPRFLPTIFFYMAKYNTAYVPGCTDTNLSSDFSFDQVEQGILSGT